MATGLSDGFEHLLARSEEQVSCAVRTGLVVVDTNVLLDAYRFAPQARQELFDALKALGDRLWIPHQVALEFHKNRADVIAEHDAAYRDASVAITNFRQQCDSDLANKIRALAGRIALDDAEKERLVKLVTGGLETAVSELEALRDRHGITSDAMRNDPVLATLQRLLDGKVGRRPTSEEDEEDRKEAARRIAEKVPPGFLDRGKVDPHGDYLLWRQSLEEVGNRKVPFLFVTRDVKEDWFWRVGGRTIGARPELVQECRREAGAQLVIMTTRTFLHHASSELMANVSADTLRQVEALPPPTVATADLPPREPIVMTSDNFLQIAELVRRDADVINQRIASLVAEDFYHANLIANGGLTEEQLTMHLVGRESARTMLQNATAQHAQFLRFREWVSEMATQHPGVRAEIPENYRSLLMSYMGRIRDWSVLGGAGEASDVTD